MAIRGYNGMLTTRVGKDVLVNSGNKWTLTRYDEYIKDVELHLDRSEDNEAFYQWYDVELGGWDEGKSN